MHTPSDLALGGVFPLAVAVLKLVVMFVILVRLDTTLALLSLSVAPFRTACLRYYSRRMTDRAEQVKARESGLIERAYEILVSVRAVKSFAGSGTNWRNGEGWRRDDEGTAQAHVAGVSLLRSSSPPSR